MLTVLDLMESSMQAEAFVRKATAEYMQAFTAPLQQAAMVKSMLAHGAPLPDSTPGQVQMAKRAAQLARGERKE